jgi:hypothetical protein
VSVVLKKELMGNQRVRIRQSLVRGPATRFPVTDE